MKTAGRAIGECAWFEGVPEQGESVQIGFIDQVCARCVCFRVGLAMNGREGRMMRTGLKGAMWEKRVLALTTMEVMKMRALNAVGLWVLTMRSRASEE